MPHVSSVSIILYGLSSMFQVLESLQALFESTNRTHQISLSTIVLKWAMRCCVYLVVHVLCSSSPRVWVSVAYLAFMCLSCHGHDTWLCDPTCSIPCNLHMIFCFSSHDLCAICPPCSYCHFYGKGTEDPEGVRACVQVLCKVRRCIELLSSHLLLLISECYHYKHYNYTVSSPIS